MGFVLFYSSWRKFIGINISKYKISINIKQNAYQKQQLSTDFFFGSQTAKSNQFSTISIKGENSNIT